MFLDYYASVTGNKNPRITESTYYKYFNQNINFTFSKPRTDVCNTCFEFEQSRLQISDDIENHKTRVTDHKQLKENILKQKKVLCLEFDIGQNLSLPKIPIL